MTRSSMTMVICSLADDDRALKYDMKNTKQVTFKFNKKTDADILEKFASVDNVQGYVKMLIRNDISQKTE